MNTRHARWTLIAGAVASATAAFAAAVTPAPPPAAKADVDVELVLAVDVSLSMMAEELAVQRNGYVAALRDPSVIAAMLGGEKGRVAITYVEWAGAGEQQIVIAWRVLETPGDAGRFADDLSRAPVQRSFRTSLSGAIDHAVSLIETNDFAGAQRVIDISGDGANNDGAAVAEARDRAVARGITVNGLPIVARVGLAGNVEVGAMDEYYANCVIGGPGAFSIPVRNWSEFSQAVRQKLTLELSGVRETGHDDAAVMTVQAIAGGAAYDCLAGERLWILQNGKL